MEEVINMIRRVVAFLFVAVVLSNLFAGSEYRKYLSYATGLITVLLILVPVWQWLDEDKTWKDYLVQSSYEQKMVETKGEIERLGEQYEETIQQQYRASIQQEIATYCGVEAKDCQLTMKGQQIQSVHVKVKEMPRQVTTWVTSLSIRYGVSEENIFIEEVAK